MSNTEFKDKFIGFVDILGWKEKVKAAESGAAMSLSELKAALKDLGKPEDANRFKNGPLTCPKSTYVQRDLDFQLTRISDCVLVSAEISPAGVINLLNHCWVAVIELLTKGIMCRGYITRGTIYHTNEPEIIGSGFQDALDREHQVSAFKRKADERGTPFVEIDRTVCDYVRGCGDSCVKEMFSRYVKNDGVVTALFPFKRLRHSFIVASWWPGYKFDPENEKQSNENIRSSIVKMKDRVSELVDRSNADAVSKAEHYIAALEAQLEVCKETDEMIDKLCTTFPKRTKK